MEPNSNDPCHGEAGRQLTFGEHAVGLTFNPGGREDVNACKAAFAAEIDRLHTMRQQGLTPNHDRETRAAIEAIQTAQMWAVKALTRL